MSENIPANDNEFQANDLTAEIKDRKIQSISDIEVGEEYQRRDIQRVPDAEIFGPTRSRKTRQVLLILANDMDLIIFAKSDANHLWVALSRHHIGEN